MYITSTPLRPPKITAKKMLALFPLFLMQVDKSEMRDMWCCFFSKAPAWFVTKTHFGQKCSLVFAVPHFQISLGSETCVCSKAISAIKVLLLHWVLQRGILIKSHCTLCSHTRSHQDDKCCWLLPGMKAGRSKKGVRWGKIIGGGKHGKSCICFFTFQWWISQHLWKLRGREKENEIKN